MPSSKEYQKEIRERWKAAGLCSMCGVVKARLDMLTCSECAIRYTGYHRGLKQKVLDAYGHKCVCCGLTQYEFLSIDHKEGYDHEERIRHTSGAFYKMIIDANFPDAYQLLCFNCNLSLGFFGYCPHHPEITRLVLSRGRYAHVAQQEAT